MLTRQQVVESCKQDYHLGGITIRYFSYLLDKGLLPVGIQDKLNRRVILHPDGTPARIALIKQLQDKENLTLRQIKALFDSEQKSQAQSIVKALGKSYLEGVSQPFVFANNGEPYDIVVLTEKRSLHCFLVEQFSHDTVPDKLRIILDHKMKLTPENLMILHKDPYEIFPK